VIMAEQNIQVKIIEGKWGVEVKDSSQSNMANHGISVKMQSREDAVRYARVCEQRTGGKASIPKRSMEG
jgi:hypothetical protein